jgi:hypothetical protein
MQDAVFAYGSLVADHRGAPAARLAGWRRHWGVAMDNVADLPRYKHYVDVETGVRARVHVAFLDIERTDDDVAVTGVLVPVDPATLGVLDARERNYDRIEVTSAVSRLDGRRLPERVWTYVGSPAGRERLREARAAGTAVVRGGYLRTVEEAYAAAPALGGLAAYTASTVPHDLPVAELRRIDAPAA